MRRVPGHAILWRRAGLVDAVKEETQSGGRVDRDAVAALLSLIPGAGQLYKHHYAEGFGLLIGGNLLAIFVSLLLSLGTFGVSLVVIPLGYIGVVAASAYNAPDWHGRHHWMHPWTEDSRNGQPSPKQPSTKEKGA